MWAGSMKQGDPTPWNAVSPGGSDPLAGTRRGRVPSGGERLHQRQQETLAAPFLGGGRSPDPRFLSQATAAAVPAPTTPKPSQHSVHDEMMTRDREAFRDVPHGKLPPPPTVDEMFGEYEPVPSDPNEAIRQAERKCKVFMWGAVGKDSRDEQVQHARSMTRQAVDQPTSSFTQAFTSYRKDPKQESDRWQPKVEPLRNMQPHPRGHTERRIPVCDMRMMLPGQGTHPVDTIHHAHEQPSAGFNGVMIPPTRVAGIAPALHPNDAWRVHDPAMAALRSKDDPGRELTHDDDVKRALLGYTDDDQDLWTRQPMA